MIGSTGLLAAAPGGQTLWYLTRGTGVVSLLFLTASVVLGVVTTVRWESPRHPRIVTAALHRNVSLLVLLFLAAHIATTVVDGFVPIGWVDAVVPFGGGYRPVWLGLGTVAFDLLIALTASSLLRERIGQRAWRLVHWAAYGCWPLALVHGLGTGFDSRQPWMLALYGASLAAVVAALMWRIAVSRPRAWAGRLVAVTAAGVVPLGIVAFAIAGPLHPGWQHRVRAAVPQGSSPVPAPGSAGGQPAPLIGGPASGTVREQPGAGGTTTEVIDLSVGSGGSERVRVTLTGRSRPGGGLSAAGGAIEIGPSAGPSRYAGPVTSIAGGRIVASRVRATGASMITVTLDLVIDHTSGEVRGSVGVGQAITGSGG